MDAVTQTRQPTGTIDSAADLSPNDQSSDEFAHELPNQTQRELQDTAALLELVGELQASEDLRRGCYALVNGLRQYLGCNRVAVGLRRNCQGPVRLQAVSGLAQFDKLSRLSQAIEAAFEEAVLNGRMSVWPSARHDDRGRSMALNRLTSFDDTRAAVCSPLRDRSGDIVGAWLILDTEARDSPPSMSNIIRAYEQPVATALRNLQRLESRVKWRLGSLCNHLRTWKGTIVLACILLMLATLAIPLPHKIHCDCKIEPVVHRFVAAPFAGTLEKSLVKPGDLVKKGDLLAHMDGREIRWEQAGLVADRKQAVKRRDASLAGRDYAEAEIAKLEIERLDLNIQLLKHRADHLQIKSPIDGIVTSGDLERAEGAPLEVGQSLFEVAPLNEMIAEIAVPQGDIAYVEEGQEVVIRIDGYLTRSRKLMVGNVQPRSEIRDNENIFVAEAMLENEKERLRPGMKGRAKIISTKRSLGWILFHRPWERLMMWLGL